MTMGRGRDAYEKAKKDSAAERSRPKYSTYDFWLKPDESALLRFRGLVDRPPISKKEIKAMSKPERKAAMKLFKAVRRKIGKDGEKEKTSEALIRRMGEVEPFSFRKHGHYNLKYHHACSEGAEAPEGEELPGCVSCFEISSGNTALSPAKMQFGWTVVNIAKQHRVERKEGNKYLTCTQDEDGHCKWCDKATDEGKVRPAKMVGARCWLMPESRANEVYGLVDDLEKKCANCGGGKILHKGWSCGNTECGKSLKNVDVDDGIRVKCKACGEKKLPVESISCKGCDDPRRARLSDAVIKVRRTGSGKNDTAYNFSVDEISPMTKEEKQCRTIDWGVQEGFDSTAVQAAKLGIKDPFGSTAIAKSYDDFDEDDDDDDDETL